MFESAVASVSNACEGRYDMKPHGECRLHLRIPFYSRFFNEVDIERCGFGKTHALRIEIM